MLKHSHRQGAPDGQGLLATVTQRKVCVPVERVLRLTMTSKQGAV